MNNFKDWAGDIRLEKITITVLEDYQRHRLAIASLCTVDRELIYVRRMLRFNDFHIGKPSPKKGKVTAQRAFTREEIIRFFDVCPAPFRTLYLMMLATGARLAELLVAREGRSTHTPLLKSEVDLERRVIHLRPSKMREGRAKAHPKIRIIPLPEWVIEPLREQMEKAKGPHVFPFIAWNMGRSFNRIIKKAGIPKLDALKQMVTAHSFRHTYATMLSELLGGNAFVLKAALGHSRITTTERYCHPTSPSLEIAFPELHRDIHDGKSDEPSGTCS